LSFSAPNSFPLSPSAQSASVSLSKAAASLPAREVFQQAVEILESSSTAVLVLDHSCIIRYCSPTAEKWFHHKASVLEGHYDIGILMESDEATKHLKRYIPRVISGEFPSRPMAGGRFVPAITRLGTVSLIRVGYQSTVIQGSPYAVAVMVKRSLLEEVMTTFERSKALAGRAIVVTSTIMGVLALLQHQILVDLGNVILETEEGQVIIDKKQPP
jgi:PAS domain-containing protein